MPSCRGPCRSTLAWTPPLPAGSDLAALLVGFEPKGGCEDRSLAQEILASVVAEQAGMWVAERPSAAGNALWRLHLEPCHGSSARTAMLRFVKELSQPSNVARPDHYDDFAYAVTHDLREPLRVVKAYTELLKSRYLDVLDTDAQQYLGFTSEAADRMTRFWPTFSRTPSRQRYRSRRQR